MIYFPQVINFLLLYAYTQPERLGYEELDLRCG